MTPARKAKKFTSVLTFGKEAEIKGKELDRYGRLVARVLVDGHDASIELVKAGLAWHFKRYSSDKVLAAEEDRAREGAHLGLWAIPNPIPPWNYRREHRRPRDSSPASPP